MSKLYFPEPDNYASFGTQELHRSRGIFQQSFVVRMP